jgi:hypothetical protein
VRRQSVIYLTTIALLGRLGFLGGKEISDNFKKSIATPPEKTQPSKTNSETQHPEQIPPAREQPKEPTNQPEEGIPQKQGEEQNEKLNPPDQPPAPGQQPSAGDNSQQPSLVESDSQSIPASTQQIESTGQINP